MCRMGLIKLLFVCLMITLTFTIGCGNDNDVGVTDNNGDIATINAGNLLMQINGRLWASERTLATYKNSTLSVTGQALLRGNPEKSERIQITIKNVADKGIYPLGGATPSNIGQMESTINSTSFNIATFSTEHVIVEWVEAYVEHIKRNVKFDGPGTFDTWEPDDFKIAMQFDNWHNPEHKKNGQPIGRVGKWYWRDRAAFKDENRQGNADSPLRLETLQPKETARAGEVTITEINESRVKGTFQFKAATLNQIATIEVTDGAFDVKL